MKFTHLAVLATLLTAAATGAAAAAAKTDTPAPTKDQLAKGAKDAPALIQAAGITCTPTVAAFRGTGKATDSKGTIDIYETACHEGMGYLILKTSGEAAPRAFDCLGAASGGTKCVLPENADPKQGLAPALASAGQTCAISDARYIGTSASSGESFYEVACGAAPGFRLGVPKTGKPEAIECLDLADSESACKLTSKELALTAVTPLVKASGRTCSVSGARYIGASTASNAIYYEVACGSSSGFVAIADASTKAFKQAIDCGKAQNVAGGCKLTDMTVSATAEIGVYTKLAAKAGFPCQVSKYRYIGQDNKNREIVELACSNRSDGGLAAFADTGPSEVYDCVRAAALGQACQLSSPAPVYARYSAALVAKGRGACKVSNALWLGRTSDEELVETACTDGAPGWVMGLRSGTDTISELLSCRQATAIGLACKLPTNVAGNKGS